MLLVGHACAWPPCLSSAVGWLIERYTEIAPEVDMIGYLDGYTGLLTGRSMAAVDEVAFVGAHGHGSIGAELVDGALGRCCGRGRADQRRRRP